MMKISRTLSFGAAMKFGLLLCLLMITIKGLSQEKTVAGIVFDKNSKDRIASVNIRNTTTGVSVYNSLKGEFKISARAGDQLVFTREYYYPDTVKVKNNIAVAIYMAPKSIQLNEVTIHDSLLSPEKRLEAKKREYSKAYGSMAYNDFLSASPGGGAGLSIDALFNSFSQSGRNAKRLRQLIDDDYRQDVIDSRFNRTLVASITGLKDEKLTDFMFRYRPGYYTTKNTSDYEFIVSIRNNLRRYLRNPRTYTLPSLISR